MSGSLRLRSSVATIALALLLVVGVAATAAWQARAISAQIGRRAIASAQDSQAAALAQRQARIRELTDVLTSDTHFTSYMSQALGAGADSGGIDIVSIHDQLEQRRLGLRIESAAILDSAGRVVIAVGEGLSGSKDLSSAPLVVKSTALAGAVDGFLENGGRVLWASVSPLRPGEADTKLVTAFVIDAAMLKEIARSSHADVGLLATTKTTRRVVASSLTGAGAASLQALADRLATSTPTGSDALGWELGDGRSYAAQMALPSTDAYALLTLVPAAGAADTWLAIAAPLAILLATLLGLVIAASIHFQRSYAGPLENLTMLSERAVKGDYDMVYRGRQSGPVGRLGSVFNHLLTDLRGFRPAPDAPRRRSTDRR